MSERGRGEMGKRRKRRGRRSCEGVEGLNHDVSVVNVHRDRRRGDAVAGFCRGTRGLERFRATRSLEAIHARMTPG